LQILERRLRDKLHNRIEVPILKQPAHTRRADATSILFIAIIDFIVTRGLKTVAVEVKSAPTVDDSDVRHLVWLKKAMGKRLTDAVVLTTGQMVYRRADGIAVVPAALLGA
jgi:predicted AAA+ superfamily ATPase